MRGEMERRDQSIDEEERWRGEMRREMTREMVRREGRHGEER